ncbi:ABC transporter related [Catenulispora acidiphila DSM 44928]|uniref:ABC transporter related n=1 Tax=Catenulispora acidiphila (strain DSM 44928 / JCM 14897 / NBRC 102108 / NRRL B-24433 / ID139908) TaxID=479433 RepID=C7QDP1_CATAD|nr:ABC transporter related [Catenulispora acidiphila DSM 44928]
MLSRLSHPVATLKSSRRVRALRLLASVSPALAWTVGAFVVAEAVLPNLTLIAMGRATGRIPAAARDGLSSGAGHSLLVALAVAGVCYGFSLLRGPAEDALSSVVRARMVVTLQRRLVTAVSAPAGIAHLEDSETLDRLANVQGQLMNAAPADAPMTIASQLGGWLSGTMACVVLSTFRWWLGLAMFAAWIAVRRPLGQLVRTRVSSFRAAGEPLRRAWYLFALATRPNAAKEARVFGLGAWLAAEHRTHYVSGLTPTWHEMRRQGRRVATVAVGVFAVFALSAGTLGWTAYHHEIGLGTLAVMLTMLPSSMTVGTVSMTDFQLEMMLTAVPDLDALTDSLVPMADAVDAVDDTSAGTSAGTVDPAGMPRRDVVFENVAFRYPGGESDVFSDLNLTLRAGESTALVGVNGAGKTTLVTLLARLRDPSRGRILVDGLPLNDLHVRDWQKQVAVVYQDYTRYPLTAEENVTLNLLGGPVDDAALRQAAERAGATDLIDNLPNGWRTILSPQYEGGTDLSGGQWQRIALARALYAISRGATVLILDEPTAQLDVRAEAAFYDRFLEITQGVTSIVISHRFSTVRRANRIAVLDAGHITELGSHTELLAQAGTYANLFTTQAAAFTGGRKRA